MYLAMVGVGMLGMAVGTGIALENIDAADTAGCATDTSDTAAFPSSVATLAPCRSVQTTGR